MLNMEEQTPAPAIFKKTSLPITLKFENLVYTIKIKQKGFWRRAQKPEERQILKGITGMVAPGEMLALLGPSGGGKTTLLTALGGRLGGKLSGSVTYNGKPFSNAIKRNIGFVTQDDILHPHLTVRETLIYTALLRLPKSLTTAEKVQQVEAVITQLGLARCKDSAVGGDGKVRGVSGGERKRVSIGLEMLINPSLLLLDEPTSGLDSTTALKIVSTLSELVSGGRTIAMTIHQPSSRLFYLFHKVILLCEGSLVYYGKPSTALDYFSSIGFSPSVPMNPADFLLDLANGVVTGESNEDAGDTKATLKSAYTANLSEEVDREFAVNRQSDSSSADGKKLKHWQNGWWTQFSVLLKRGTRERKNDFFSTLTLIQIFVMTFICGLLWWRSNTDARMEDQVGLLFFIATYFGFNSLFQAIFTFPKERKMLEKERASGMYRLSSYFMALNAGDIPMSIALPAALFTVVYWMAALKHTATCFFGGLFVLIYSVVCNNGLGLAIGALVEDMQDSTLTASVLMSIFTLVGGLYVQHPPKFISWLKYFSTVNHTFKMLLATQYHKDETYHCANHMICKVADISFVKSVGPLNEGTLLSTLVMAAILLGCRLIAFWALTRLGAPK